ncbi:CopG family transcriptional regulator [Georgenia sp. Z1344]|uniref:ribbon-helix-helix domain-containing protein n=1 Tax=Georgenia sp. Z1344 TaxID=3416706 RepID=UPI003CEA4DD5
MRTTLTLDDDVARLVDEAVHRDRRSMKEVVNDALRAALAPPPVARPYTVDVHHSAIRTGIDAGRLNQLVDEIDTDDAHSPEPAR